MKSILTFFVAMVLLSASAGAMDYYYSTTGLNSMAHDYAYTWGLNNQWNPGETITGAYLKFYDIYDWTVETDTLFVTLLDDPPLGVHSVYDGQGSIANYFDGMGEPLGVWSDPNGGSSGKTNIQFNFCPAQFAAFVDYAADGRFGFGIDPHCHYYAGKTELVVTTSAVPEPTTMVLIGLGLTGLGIFRSRK